MPRKLLVVDDSSTISEAVRLALVGEDWTLAAAASTAEAVEAVQGGAPDAVLCDVALGEEDGYEACRTLRAALQGTQVPVILTGGNVSEGLAASAGAAAVLAKPFQSDELLDTLEYSLQQAGWEPGQDDLLSLDPGSSPQAGPDHAWPGAAAAHEVEVIDLSDDDEFSDLDWIEDLEPLSAARAGEQGDPGSTLGTREERLPGSGEASSRCEEWVRVVDSMHEFGARPRDREVPGPDSFAPIELDLTGFGGVSGQDAEPEREEEGAGGRRPDPGVSEDGALDIEAASETGSGAEGKPGDLLGDIDLEGWAEENHPQGPQAEPLRGEETARRTPPSQPEWETPKGETEPTREPSEEREWIWELPPEGGPDRELGGSFPLRDDPAAHSWDAEPRRADDLSAAWPPPSGAADPTALRKEPSGAEPEAVATAEAPWDLSAAEPAPLAAHVAGGAAEAVRRALEESLSPDKLTPLVAATVERVVWDVVPQLAERLIREAIEKLQREPPEGAA